MPAPLPVGGLTVASIGLTAVVVGNAYYQKKQFYPSVVYITKSNPSMAAIYLLAFTFVILLGKFLKKIFFGQLRTAEFEQLIERSFYAVTETCLAFTVFRDDFSPKFVALFTVLLFLKAFHYLTDSRVDFMERSPVITVLFHIRVSSLLLLLIMIDLLLLNHSYLSTITHGASVQLVFGFEYAILLTVAFNIIVKYLCHTIDLRSENPWENKAVYLLYTELFVGLIKVILYAVFLFIMIRIHTFPLFIIRPMYLTIRSFKNALNDVIQSRRAIHNMNTLYPDATPEELAAVDNVCIICREEMMTGAKKLPCGHIFHASCLRSWFQRQQTCPTCRMDILQHNIPVFSQAPQQQPQQPQQPQQEGAGAAVGGQQPQTTQTQDQQRQDAAQNLFGNLNLPPGMFRPPFPAFPFNQALQQHTLAQRQNAQQSSAAESTATTVTSSSSGSSNSTASSTTTYTTAFANSTTVGAGTLGFPFGSVPPFMPFLPFTIPPPSPPTNFEGLTLEELKRMEGNKRSHVEARIKALKNIQILLDAAAVQLSQYNSVVSSLEAEADVCNQAVENELKSNAEKPEKTDETADCGGPSDSANLLCGNLQESIDETQPVPSSTGARPKTTGISSSILSENTSPSEANTSAVDNVPLLTGHSFEIDPDDPQEIRRRRLEKFSGSQGSTPPNL